MEQDARAVHVFDLGAVVDSNTGKIDRLERLREREIESDRYRSRVCSMSCHHFVCSECMYHYTLITMLYCLTQTRQLSR